LPPVVHFDQTVPGVAFPNSNVGVVTATQNEFGIGRIIHGKHALHSFRVVALFGLARLAVKNPNRAVVRTLEDCVTPRQEIHTKKEKASGTEIYKYHQNNNPNH